jgi:hypothetical protein
MTDEYLTLIAVTKERTGHSGLDDLRRAMLRDLSVISHPEPI